MEEKKEQIQNEVKKGKKVLVIVIVAIIAIGSIIALTFGGRVFRTKDEPKDTDTKEEIKNEEANITPPEKSACCKY